MRCLAAVSNHRKLLAALAASLTLHLAILLNIEWRVDRHPQVPIPAAAFTGLTVVLRSAPLTDVASAEAALVVADTSPKNGLDAEPVDEPNGGNMTVPLAAPPQYRSGAELDHRPQPREAVIVPYPATELSELKGSVVVVLYINASGAIDRLELVDSNLPDAFGQAAIEAFRSASMQPGEKDGLPVPSRMKIMVEFERLRR